MKLEVKNNVNYSAQIVEIKNLISLENCDNIQGTMILGNHIIISNDVREGDVGVFFPVESKLSDDYLKFNNLYRDKTLNEDQDKQGFFELNGRVRCVKLRGSKSEGLFMPLESLSYCLSIYIPDLFIEKLGESFDHINDIKICEKYVIPKRQQSQRSKQGKKPKISKIVPDQFHFHLDTEQLGRNLDRFTLDTPIQVSVKVHGTSAISSNILCKKKLNLFHKLLLKSRIKLETTYYDNIYSSRKVIKNDDINKTQHFYSEDIWQKGNDFLKEYLDKGMTIYYEIVGYLSDNSYIQKGYDYGCDPGKFDIYIYRITYTNTDGKIYEFSSEQLQIWCKERGLKSVIELWRGTIQNLFDIYGCQLTSENWKDNIVEYLRDIFEIEKDCYLCKNKVSFEGIVLRKLDTLGFEAYKLKSFNFLKRETDLLDKNETNVEDDQDE